MLANFKWNGAQIIAGAQAALSRAVVSIAQGAAEQAKRLVEVGTGTLQRSIHVAPVNYTGGEQDEQQAAAGTDLGAMAPSVTIVQQTPTKLSVEVGSWIAYACIEETVHGPQYITPGVELMRGIADEIVMAAFVEQGLV
jgi:hypothetical protein